MKRQPQETTVQSIIRKSIFNQVLKDTQTDIKNLMLNIKCSDKTFNIIGLDITKGYRLSEIHYRNNNNMYDQYYKKNTINSLKSLNTSNQKYCNVKKDIERHSVTQAGRRNIKQRIKSNKQQIKSNKQQIKSYKQQLDINFETVNEFQTLKTDIQNNENQNDKIQTEKFINKANNFIFQPKIPSVQSEQAAYKIIKFKNPETVDSRIIKRQTIYEQSIRRKISKQSNSIPITRQPIPEFIKPSLELHKHNVKHKSQTKATFSYFKFDSNLVKQQKTPRKNIDGSNSKRIRYSVKNKKKTQELFQRRKEAFNNCPSQLVIKQKVSTVKNEQSPIQRQLRSRQQRIHEKTIFMNRYQRKRPTKNQEINLCGWQLNQNINDGLLEKYPLM